jgi:hypothetical protein
MLEAVAPRRHTPTYKLKLAGWRVRCSCGDFDRTVQGKKERAEREFAAHKRKTGVIDPKGKL